MISINAPRAACDVRVSVDLAGKSFLIFEERPEENPTDPRPLGFSSRPGPNPLEGKIEDRGLKIDFAD